MSLKLWRGVVNNSRWGERREFYAIAETADEAAKKMGLENHKNILSIDVYDNVDVFDPVEVSSNDILSQFHIIFSERNKYNVKLVITEKE